MALEKDLYQRLAVLTPSQRAALAQQLGQLRAEKQQPPASQSLQAPQRLVAYVVSNPAIVDPDFSALRDSLKAKLPHYMVPAVIVPLAALPRTANGKIDTKALPDPQLVSPNSDRATAPRSPIEETLAKIWRDVLGLSPISVHDNFFELGGDSILSIQIVSKAREAGLRLAPNQLFEQPTIAELATVVNLIPELAATQTAVTGSVPLTPIQHWFFEQALAAPHHWHQAMLVELPAEVSRSAIEAAIAALWTHHDALRLRFSHNSTGWRQMNAEGGHPPALVQIDLSPLSPPEQIAAVAQHGGDLHASLTLSEGGLMRVAHLTRGANQPSWLLISLHHLVVDTVSWQILFSDLAQLLNQLERPGQPAPLPAKTTAFKTWAEILTAQAAVRQSEAAFWLAQVEPPAIRLPPGRPNPTPSTEATAYTLTVGLDAADTHTLLQSVPTVYHTQINDVLLTALAQTLLYWAGVETGGVRVDVEAHGREPILPEVDLSRTVGWFTTTYPVRLQLAEVSDCAAALKSIKEQLRQIPDRGIGYGIVRYLGDQPTRRRLAQAQPSEVLFNYLGQLDRTLADANIRMIQNIDLGRLRDFRNRRSHRLEINAWITDAALKLNWIFDTQVYQVDTITTLANHYISALKAIIAHCSAPNSGGFTPSDFPDADLSQSELDAFIGQLTQEA